MNVLITGGAGYIGSHTAKQIAKAGHMPVCIDDMSFGHDWAVKWGPLEKGNFGDAGLIKNLISKHRIGAVIHFAANAFVGESVSNPRKYYQNNVVNTLSLLNTILEADIKTFVFSSSCATYGNPIKLPLTEDHPQHPVNPYGQTKLTCEEILKWYAPAYGLCWAALRYFNASGADPDGEIGEDHNPETHLIPLVIHAAMGKRPQIDIFGTDYPTPDGSAIRDYIHVTDLADAHVAALKHLMDGKENLQLNLGTGKGNSVREVIRTVEKVSGKKVPVRETGRREGDPPELVADARKANTLLGWRPKFADLETIVAHAWRWHSSQK
jgi:UDP-arabinose 4-epimerase